MHPYETSMPTKATSHVTFHFVTHNLEGMNTNALVKRKLIPNKSSSNSASVQFSPYLSKAFNQKLKTLTF
jgi:hypothetical protein